MNRYYAIYKGDQFLFVGTIEECAKHLDVTPHTIRHYASPSYKKRAKNPDKVIMVYRVED